MAEPATETRVLKLIEDLKDAGTSIRDLVAAMHEAAHVIVIRDVGHLDTQVGQKDHENGIREHWTAALGGESIPTPIAQLSITAALVMADAIEELAPGLLHAPTDWFHLCELTGLTPDEIRDSEPWGEMLDWILPRQEEIGRIAVAILKGQDTFRWEGDQEDD